MRLLFPAFLASPLSALAQTPPDNFVAQELQRQQERERLLREQQERQPDVRLQAPGQNETPLPVENETPCFTIREILLDSDTPVFAWARQAADRPDPATGHCLGSKGINQVMSRIQNAITERGYVTTRVLAEAQDLTSGTLKLKIIPGRIRSIRFSPESDSRANAWNAFPAAPGDLLNLRDIEQALENWKRVPTAEADIQIAPGEVSGESDVLIAWKQAFPLRFSLSVNNGGSRSTGKNIGSATVSGDHLLTLNDLFYASFNHDLGGGEPGRRGTRGHTLHYSLPWGYWLLAFTTSENRYHQSVAGASQTYLYRGTSENHEIKLSRTLYRDSINKTSLFLRGYLNKSANFIDDTEIEVQRRRMAGWEGGVQHRVFLGEAVLNLDLAYRRGTGAFNALRAPEEAFGEGSARPRLISADVSIDVPFKLAGQNFRYSGRWRAQWNRSPIVPQDRFSIGGRYTVRGFDGESILMAERGWLMRNDLGLGLPERQEIYLGLDHGQVGGHTAALLVGKRLTGAALGLRGGFRNFAWDMFVSKPLDKPKDFKTARHTSGFNLAWNW
ncbi:hemolysin secretion/activation protein, ShlB/FhaC/HecB family [Betaproteobacteria bacterium]|nr:hemolysin secretion/activation protein, ShlB/FhaC/HecB family [Betaproteobacteria bacterium]